MEGLVQNDNLLETLQVKALEFHEDGIHLWETEDKTEPSLKTITVDDLSVAVYEAGLSAHCFAYGHLDLYLSWVAGTLMTASLHPIKLESLVQELYAKYRQIGAFKQEMLSSQPTKPKQKDNVILIPNQQIIY